MQIWLKIQHFLQNKIIVCFQEITHFPSEKLVKIAEKSENDFWPEVTIKTTSLAPSMWSRNVTLLRWGTNGLLRLNPALG
jgi:hypothetical protein